MALKRAGLQPVGTVPQYAKTSGRNAYAGYGSKSSETENDKSGVDAGAVNAGILGAMAAKSGYDWADKNGYVDKAKEWMFGPQEGSSYFAPGGAGYGGNPNGIQASGPWGNAAGHFGEGAAGTGFGNAGMNASMANGGQFALNAGADYANAGMQASQAASQAAAQAAAQAGTQAAATSAAEMTPEMIAQLGLLA